MPKTWTVTPSYVHPNACHHIVSILYVIHIHAVDIGLQFAVDMSGVIHMMIYYNMILVENIIILESLYHHILTVTWLPSCLVPSPMVRAFQRLQLLQQQLTRGVASGEHFLDVNGRKLSPDLNMDSRGEPLPFLPKSWFSAKWVCPTIGSLPFKYPAIFHWTMIMGERMNWMFICWCYYKTTTVCLFE